MEKIINDSLKTEYYHLAFKIKMAEGTNDFLKIFFLLMTLLDIRRRRKLYHDTLITVRL